MPSRLFLLGLPKVEQAGATKALRLNNPSRLAIYLAAKQDWVSRSELAFLFRPDDDESTALSHIRVLLHRTKQFSWAKALEIERRQVRLLIDTDVAAFKQAVAAENWPQVSKLYTGGFLGDYSAAELATYSAWIDLERGDLENSYQEAMSRYAADLERESNHAGAAQVLDDLLKLDPFAEDILRQHMKNCYLAGQRDRALKTYEQFAAMLRQEYDAEPLADTQKLTEQIKNNDLATPSILPDVPTPSTLGSKHHMLPQQSTRFVGRQRELKDLTTQLAHQDCRLLTLVGMGGSGKTRLALELANRFDDLEHGVCFVALAPLNSTDSLVTTIAASLDLTLAPREDPKTQLLRYLADKELLLVLDNFEHLRGATPLLSDLLARSKALKLLVTSRESLRLQGEWLYDVGGLSYPAPGNAPNAADHYDAVTLFINSAKRVAPQLTLGEADHAAVIQICQQVAGLPLALELAASWARLMSIPRIAEELTEGYTLLRSEESDLPERHRNLEAILAKTWQDLSKKKELRSLSSPFFRADVP